MGTFGLAAGLHTVSRKPSQVQNGKRWEEAVSGKIEDIKQLDCNFFFLSLFRQHGPHVCMYSRHMFIMASSLERRRQITFVPGTVQQSWIKLRAEKVPWGANCILIDGLAKKAPPRI